MKKKKKKKWGKLHGRDMPAADLWLEHVPTAIALSCPLTWEVKRSTSTIGSNISIFITEPYVNQHVPAMEIIPQRMIKE